MKKLVAAILAMAVILTMPVVFAQNADVNSARLAGSQAKM
ncbi:hypothetical protein SATMO3_17650 [Sporomusa aerivorans]